MTFELPPLPYDYNALEPYIDTLTMHLHHDRHHQTYVTNLNNALQGLDAPYSTLTSLSVDDLLRRINEVPENIRTMVRNNGGGHANHSMFWQIMGPNGGDLAQAIEQAFGSFEQFKMAFTDAGAKRFGSGWAWLVLDRNGILQVLSTANQDSPLMDGLYPVLGNDVWEHAYYLTYQNRRPDYLKAWWNVVNWDAVGQRYDQARRGSSI